MNTFSYDYIDIYWVDRDLYYWKVSYVICEDSIENDSGEIWIYLFKLESDDQVLKGLWEIAGSQRKSLKNLFHIFSYFFLEK